MTRRERARTTYAGNNLSGQALVIRMQEPRDVDRVGSRRWFLLRPVAPTRHRRV